MINAGNSEIAYTSFESNGKGNWAFSGTPITDFNPATGEKSYKLSSGNNITKTALNATKTYVVTYWSRSGPQSVNGSLATVIGNNVNGWTYYKYKITGTTTITISGSGVIDELRLYPLGAQMETYTYDPLVGMTSKCSINNDVTYYDYDAFGRLKSISDQFRKVIKKYCYNYAGQTQSCSAAPATVNPTSLNSAIASGFTAKYTNVNTGAVTTYSISSVDAQSHGLIYVSGTSPLPAGNYNLTIENLSSTAIHTFACGCGSLTTDGASATFYNISVSPTLCNQISIN